MKAQPADASLDDFLAWHSARVLRRTGTAPAASTMRSTATRLRSAMRAAGTTEVSVLCTRLTVEDDAEAILDRMAVTNTPGSLRLVYEACKAVHAYGRALGWIDDALAMETPAKNPQKAITVYTAEEVEKLVATARGKSLRWWAFLAMMAHSGRRVSEVLGLSWDDLHLDAEVPHFELATTKNKRQAYVPLDKFLVAEVLTAEHCEQLRTAAAGRFTRPVSQHPFPWSYTCADKMFRAHCERVGIVSRGFHCFRHTKATEMLARGVPIQAVSAILGHANVATTDRIYHHATALNYAGYLEAAV